MSLEKKIQTLASEAVQQLFDAAFPAEQFNITTTPKDFTGHYTITVFPLTRLSKLKPEETAEALGKYIHEHAAFVKSYNVVKGFLNLEMTDKAFIDALQEISIAGPNYARVARQKQKVVLEYSSPNTNKPLHLGHIRNNLLGYSMANILEMAGKEVVKVQVINDRGIHICKSMLAWQLFADGETPETNGIKGDHLVGKYYVMFDKKFKEEYTAWQQTEEGQAQKNEWLANPKNLAKATKEIGETADEASIEHYFFKEVYKNTYFNKFSKLGMAATKMLEDWENNVPEVRSLWEMMNGWVFEGMNKTYEKLGVSFEKNYFESQTYLSGVDMIEKGLKNGVFFKAEDGSTRIDLKDVKLDEKVVLRSNGTSVYITQDIGMANLRDKDYQMDSMVYVVGDEQEYHFKVLFEILKRLGEHYAQNLFHLSYGMVELPTGRMKTREGTVVDADDIMDEVIAEVKAASEERDTLAGLSQAEQAEIWRKVGMGALKFFILKVDPKKKMIFDPKQSIDLQGFTGPYIQNAFVRTQAVQRKAKEMATETASSDLQYTQLEDCERELIYIMMQYPNAIKAAANNYNPSEIAAFAYDLGKAYHRFWNDVSILRSAPHELAFRLELSKTVAHVLKSSMDLLGIEMPERM